MELATRKDRREMKGRRVLIVIALLLAIPTLCGADGHILKFQKKIGADRDGLSGWVSYVAFNRDGSMVASDGPATPSDETSGLAFWSFLDGKLIRKVPFSARSLSYDWKYCLSDHAVIDVESGKPIIPLTADDTEHAGGVFSHDGSYLAITKWSEKNRPRVTHIQIMRMPEGTVVNEFGKRAVMGLSFHPNNEILASGHWDNVTLWNITTGERIALFRGFGRYVCGISFSPDGKLLAAGTDLGGLQIWDVSRRKLLRSVSLGGQYVSDPVFSPDGRLIAVGVYGTGTVSLIDVRTGVVLDKARVSDMGCGSVAFSPDGKHLIAPSTGGLITWPYDKGGTIRVFQVRAIN